MPSPTQLKLANDKLAKSNVEREETLTRLQSILDNTADAHMTINESGSVEDYNAACVRIFGHLAEDAVGRDAARLLEVTAEERRPADLLHLLEAVAGESASVAREVVGRRQDGSSVPLEMTVSAIQLGDRRLFSAILRDISDRKIAENRREEMIDRLQTFNSELERSNQELDDFAYVASHDLREPLRAVYSHASILLEEQVDRLDQDGEQRLRRVISLSQRLEQLIADLLYFSRLGRAKLAAEPIDIQALIDQVEQDHAEALGSRNARVTVAGDLPTIEASATQVTTLFQNLIMNGVKYNDSEEKIVEIGFHPLLEQGGETHEKVFYVRDNGIGIKDMFKQDVFRIFKRLNKEKAYGEGTGAGLTFAKKIVENHGGTIWLESDFGHGTTFFFTLGGTAQ